MGSAVLTFMLFLGIMIVLRSVLFGVIPYLQKKKMEKQETGRKKDDIKANTIEKKEQD